MNDKCSAKKAAIPKFFPTIFVVAHKKTENRNGGFHSQ